MANDKPLWIPDEQQKRGTLLWKFMEFVADSTGHTFQDYETLYRWSINDKETFWRAVWSFCGVIGEIGERTLNDGNNIEKARWFPDARLNYAENLLRQGGKDPAIFFQAEDKVQYRLSHDELIEKVTKIAFWLRSVGIRPGDRVAGYLPNIPETVVTMLATASIGAVWTSSSPDFGFESLIDRFGQTEPRVLFCSDGYYNGKAYDMLDRVERISKALPTVEHTVIIPFIHSTGEPPGLQWSELLNCANDEELQFTPMGFNDPLFILYSSGTTGKPKCITHKVGGTLLQHLKEHQLHCDVKPNDRVFYSTTCGWMMWNWLVSALASEATLVLYDGSPFFPDKNVLWEMAENTKTTLFGTSAKYIDSMKKMDIRPTDQFDLSTLKTVCSTGSVLAPESFDYVYNAVKTDVCLASISGGTDLISCFVLGCPLLPVYRGESQCVGLGMAVEVYDQQGNSIVEEKGELVCTATFPSQPIYFWNDLDGSKYHNAYFSSYANVWHHGDYVKVTHRQTVQIYGRSDTTLKPSGVRIGTAEIYRYVEQLEEVMESLVIGQQWDNDERIILFVVLRNSLALNKQLEQKIRQVMREKCSPKHVPAKIVQVTAIPRTKSGKIVELAVREVIHNRPVTNLNSLANPEALELYKSLPELQ